MKTSTARYIKTGSEHVDRPTPNKDFVVLPPGATFESGSKAAPYISLDNLGENSYPVPQGI
jgi:hypothetical protein